MLLLLVCFASALSFVQCHSWLACTDYLEENGVFWDQGKCRAFARHSETWCPRDALFGLDFGFDFRGSSQDVACKTTRDDTNAYTQKHPMAVFYPGQKVILVHPTKNHCNDVRCTGKWLHDTMNKLYIGPRNGQVDLPFSQFKQNEIYDMGVSPRGGHLTDEETMTYPKPGYQNAPAFCQNMDKSMGTYTIYIPNHLQAGRYTFMWVWEFNPGEVYSTCFEADVVTSRSERDSVLRQRGLSTADPVDASKLSEYKSYFTVPT